MNRLIFTRRRAPAAQFVIDVLLGMACGFAIGMTLLIAGYFAG
jgi:hypothetical protein